LEPELELDEELLPMPLFEPWVPLDIPEEGLLAVPLVSPESLLVYRFLPLDI
jgi:hypothetical protein